MISPDTKPFCSAPWRGVTVRENGDVKTCCAGITALGNLNKSSIRDILEQSPVLENIKQTLLSGQIHENCMACASSQNSRNFASLRYHYEKNYPLDNTDYQLKFLDVRWNNKCNLACQYCSPVFSSIWEDRLGLKVGSSKKNYHDELMTWVLEKSGDLTELMLVGGEPLLMKQNYELLKKLPATCQISIITNLSYDLEHLPCFDALVSRDPSLIIWNVSAENIGAQLEYVRNGISWPQFSNNLRTLVKYWPDTVSLNMVYSIFNALDLQKIVAYYHEQGIKKITLQPIDGNPTMDVFNMPNDMRQSMIEVIESLKEWHDKIYGIDADLYPISGLESIRQGLISPSRSVNVTSADFYTKIDWYDSWSHFKFRDLWPNVVAAVDKYLK